MKIILASASPRRRELMRRAGIPCEAWACDADESMDGLDVSPAEAVRIISGRKAALAAKTADSPAVIIAADTAVYIDQLLLGKPKDEHAAFEMLNRLQGRRHTVYTGVTLLRTGANPTEQSFTESADVYMRALDAFEINAYIATGEPFDKAGAYGVQEKGSLLVERIEGDYHTVVGLPLARLCMGLRMLGVQVMTDLWQVQP